MADQMKPVLEKPPGYRPPNGQTHFPPAARQPGGKTPLPQTYRPRKKPRYCRICCCYTTIFLLVLLCLLAAVSGFAYLWYDPQLPVFRIQSIEFPRLNMTGNSDESKITLQTVAKIELKNPNNVLSVQFDETEVTLKAGELELGTATAPAFDQEKKKTMILKLTTPVKELTMDTMMAKKFVDGIKSKSIMIGTVVKTGVGVGADGINTMKPSIKAYCGGMSLRAIQGGAVPKCKITVFQVIDIDT